MKCLAVYVRSNKVYTIIRVPDDVARDLVIDRSDRPQQYRYCSKHEWKAQERGQ
jgi:hypothetical protein